MRMVTHDHSGEKAGPLPAGARDVARFTAWLEPEFYRTLIVNVNVNNVAHMLPFDCTREYLPETH